MEKKQFKRTKPTGTQGKEAYKPSLIDGYMAFVMSHISLPWTLLTAPINTEDLRNYIEFCDSKGMSVTLKGVISKALRPKKEEDVFQATEQLISSYGKTDDSIRKALEYRLGNFEKLTEFTKNEDYKEVNLDFIQFVDTNFAG